MSDEIRVNGNQYSWGSITLKIRGDLFSGFTSITISDKRERVLAYGMGRHHSPRGRSSGRYTPDPVKITGWRASVAAARAGLAAFAKDQKSYGNVEFDVITQYFEDFDGPPLVVLCEQCVWISNNAADEEAPDPLKEEIEVQPMRIYRNGLSLFDGTTG